MGGSLPQDQIMQEEPCMCRLVKLKESYEPSDSGDPNWLPLETRKEPFCTTSPLGYTGQGQTDFPPRVWRRPLSGPENEAASGERPGQSALFDIYLCWTPFKILSSRSLSLSGLLFWASSWKQHTLLLKVWVNPFYFPNCVVQTATGSRAAGSPEGPRQPVYRLGPSRSRRCKSRQETSSRPRSLIGESENSGLYREMSQAGISREGRSREKKTPRAYANQETEPVEMNVRKSLPENMLVKCQRKTFMFSSASASVTLTWVETIHGVYGQKNPKMGVITFERKKKKYVAQAHICIYLYLHLNYKRHLLLELGKQWKCKIWKVQSRIRHRHHHHIQT